MKDGRTRMDERLNQDQLGLSKPQHTPTPWNHRPKDLQSLVRYITVEDSGFDRIVAHVLPTDKDDSLANAAFIVRAVNSYEEMLSALKRIEKAITPTPDKDDNVNLGEVLDSLFGIMPVIQQVIAKAECR